MFRSNPTYAATFRIAAGIRSQAPTGSFFAYDGYYGWLASEILTDDLAEIIRGPAFAQDVRAELANPALADGVTWQAERPKKAHRLVDVSVVAPTAVAAQALGEAAGRVLEGRAGKYLAALGAPDTPVTVVDPIRIEQRSTSSGRAWLEIMLRATLGFVAGSGIVFFLAYLDTTIRTVGDVQRTLGLPVLGEIPPSRRRH